MMNATYRKLFTHVAFWKKKLEDDFPGRLYHKNVVNWPKGSHYMVYYGRFALHPVGNLYYQRTKILSDIREFGVGYPMGGLSWVITKNGEIERYNFSEETNTIKLNERETADPPMRTFPFIPGLSGQFIYIDTSNNLVRGKDIVDNNVIKINETGTNVILYLKTNGEVISYDVKTDKGIIKQTGIVDMDYASLYTTDYKILNIRSLREEVLENGVIKHLRAHNVSLTRYGEIFVRGKKLKIPVPIINVTAVSNVAYRLYGIDNKTYLVFQEPLSIIKQESTLVMRDYKEGFYLGF
jgi:hypothetical protein